VVFLIFGQLEGFIPLCKLRALREWTIRSPCVMQRGVFLLVFVLRRFLTRTLA
jgi:guanyl-specific ribonuclease Sa